MLKVCSKYNTIIFIYTCKKHFFLRDVDKAILVTMYLKEEYIKNWLLKPI